MNSPERLNVLDNLPGSKWTQPDRELADIMNAPKGKELWGNFFKIVKQGNHRYEGFLIKCERHPDRTALIKCAIRM
jgi:hypothetical protein